MPSPKVATQIASRQFSGLVQNWNWRVPAVEDEVGGKDNTNNPVPEYLKYYGGGKSSNWSRTCRNPSGLLVIFKT